MGSRGAFGGGSTVSGMLTTLEGGGKGGAEGIFTTVSGLVGPFAFVATATGLGCAACFATDCESVT